MTSNTATFGSPSPGNSFIGEMKKENQRFKRREQIGITELRPVPRDCNLVISISPDVIRVAFDRLL